MSRERKIEISDLLGKQYVVIGSMENEINFLLGSARIQVNFGKVVNEFFAELVAAHQADHYSIRIPVPAGAAGATVVLLTEQDDYNLQKIIAFASDMAA